MRTTRLTPSRLLLSVKHAFRFLRDAPCLAGFAVFAGVILAGCCFCIQRTVHIRIRLDAPISGGVQVFYRSEPNQQFSEFRCISVRTIGTPAVVDINVPVRQLWGLRFDFGSAPGEFTVLDGRVGTIPLPRWRKWSFSPDLILRSPIDGSKELRLFSDGTDPYMFVSFRRPIESLSRPRGWSRERLVFLLSMALAAALATSVVLWNKPRTESRLHFERGRKGLVWSCLLFLMAFFFVVGVRMASRGCDMGVHIAIADSIDIKDLLSPLEFWQRHFYPMWHLLVRLVKGVLRLKSTTLAAGLVNGLCYNVCLIGVYAFLRRKFPTVNPCALIGVAFAVCTVGCMLGPWLDIAHLHENTHNKWHNPTNSMVKALALPCVLLTSSLWDDLAGRWMVRTSASPDGGGPSRPNRVWWPRIMALGLLLVLTELAKPSFIQVYLPALALFFAGWFFANRRSVIPALLLSLALIAPCLVLMSQYLLAFDSEGGGGIGFGFMKAIGHYRHAWLNQIYAIAFPFAAFVAAMLRRKMQTEDVLCWLMFVVGTAMRLFLFERGPNMMDGNLGWGYAVALYLIWSTGVRQYVDLAISPRGPWSRSGFWLLSFMLFLHLFPGLFKMYDMMFLGSII